MPPDRRVRGNVLHMEKEVRGFGRDQAQAPEDAGGRERQAETHRGRSDAGVDRSRKVVRKML